MSESFGILLAKNTITLSSPLLLAALGGFFSERGGVVNIALEGKMLMSACITALATIAFNNPYLGLAAGVSSSVLLSFVHWLMTQGFRVDAVVSGMAVNVVAFGATSFLYARFADPARIAPTPFLAVQVYYVAAFAAPLLVWAYIRWTRGGLRLVAVGGDPDKARQMGVAPQSVRFWSLTATGVFTGLAGAAIVTNSGQFVEEMTAGRGYIALAALILGGWRPIPTALACIGFGMCSALQIMWQGTELLGARIPPEAWTAFPYLVTVVAISGFAAKNRAPAGMGKL